MSIWVIKTIFRNKWWFLKSRLIFVLNIPCLFWLQLLNLVLMIKHLLVAIIVGLFILFMYSCANYRCYFCGLNLLFWGSIWRYISVCWCVSLCLLCLVLIQLILYELLSKELLIWTNQSKIVLRTILGGYTRVALTSYSWIVDRQRIKIKSLISALIICQYYVFREKTYDLLILLVSFYLLSIWWKLVRNQLWALLKMTFFNLFLL